MSYSEYDAVVKPKIAGVCKIHHAFLGLNYDLDFFITLSSIASLVGNRGPEAYAAGGTFMSAFRHYRNAVGLPCSTIDLAPVQGIGYLAENEQRKTDAADTLSVDWIDDTELHRLLAAATTGDLANTCQHHCITDLGALQSMTVKKNSGRPLGTKVSIIMMKSVDEIDRSKPLGAYGLDSLITIEVRNWIFREIQAGLQIMEILVAKSVVELSRADIETVENHQCSSEI
ncbi:polyketide synthase [Histoplasma ohiense]|nr:polyketide synthase [Histoplasma ohiense (nom. inval.)]